MSTTAETVMLTMAHPNYMEAKKSRCVPANFVFSPIAKKIPRNYKYIIAHTIKTQFGSAAEKHIYRKMSVAFKHNYKIFNNKT